MTPNAETLAYRRLAAAARRWLMTSPWAGDLLDALNLDRRTVVAWVGDLEPLAQLTLEL